MEFLIHQGEMTMDERTMSLQEAREACLQGDYTRAYDLYEALLNAYPGNPQILLEYGKAIYGEYNDLEKAARLFEQALESDPNLVEALLWLADIAAAGYGPEQIGAVSLYRRVIELDPKNVDAYIGLGLQHHAPSVSLSLEEAIEAFRKATQLDLQRSDGWIDLGMALLESGHQEGARRAFVESIHLLHGSNRQKLIPAVEQYIARIDSSEPIKNAAFYNFSPRYQ